MELDYKKWGASSAGCEDERCEYLEEIMEVVSSFNH